MAGYKKDRTAEDIKREIIAVIREMKDPRLKAMLTIVRVDISSDASSAKVYISALEGIESARTAVEGLTGASGFIRREIGGRLRLRKTPELTFIADNSVEHGMEIVKKLNILKAERHED